jgi:periplasmic protein TonB
MAVAMPACQVPRKQVRTGLALVVALGIEAALLAASFTWLLMRPSSPNETLVPIVMEQLLAEKIPEPRPEPERITKITPPSAPTAARTQATPVPTPPSVVAAPQLVNPVASPIASPQAAAAHAEPAPTSAPVHTAPVSPAPPQAQAQPVPEPSASYKAQLAAAAQAAYQVPTAADALGFKGRTLVEFNLRDTVVTHIRLKQSSGLGAADRAALKAVQMAAYPVPESALQGRELVYQIWVECK